MADTSLIKSGDVLFQMKSLLKVSWVKKFCVLYQQTEDERAYMELFEDKQTFTDYKQKKKKCDIRKIELHHLKSVKTSSEKKKDGTEYTLELKIGKKSNFLQFKKESDLMEWKSKLEEVYGGGSGGSRENSASYGDDDEDSCGENDEVVTVNQMYAQTDPVQRFAVTVDESTLAKLCDITGQMTLLVGKSEITFENPKTRTLKYSFQLGWMRRFGKVGNSVFSFECGRKCPNGEGEVKCETSSAKEIHKLITKQSKSNSSTVIPHSPIRRVPDKIIQPLKPDSNDHHDEPPLPKKPDDLGVCSGPLTINVGARHPGVGKNLPTLTPIVRQASVEADHSRKSKALHSNHDHSDKQLHSIKDNGHVRPASYKSALSNPIAKELEQLKLHGPHEEHTHEHTHHEHTHHEPTKKDSVKTKEDKKKEKEERKERERREKEEKKEEERRLKEQEKERKQKDKEAKKSGKKDKLKDSDKPDTSTRNGSFKLGGERLYEEADMVIPASGTVEDDPNSIYDEATSPPPAPVEYAQPFKNKNKNKSSVKAASYNDELLYDEAVSANSANSTDKHSPKVVYTQPYTNKGGVPVPQSDLYTDVKHVKGDAWKQLGRENEEHEENYSNIKRAHEQMNKDKKSPPIVPAKNYDDDEIDDTYDTVGLKSKNIKPVPKKTENLYGVASATDVGKLPEIVEPEADYETDSDEGEEVTYDDPNYDYEDDYQTPAEVQQQSGTGEDAYEEAVVPAPVPTKPPPTKTPTPKASVRRVPDALYEDIN